MSSSLPTRHPVAVTAILVPWVMWLMVWILSPLTILQAGEALASWWATITIFAIFTVHIVLWQEYTVDPPYVPPMLMLVSTILVIGIPTFFGSEVGGLMWLLISPGVMYTVIDKCYKVKVPSVQAQLNASVARTDATIVNLTNPDTSDLDPELLNYARQTVTPPKLCKDLPRGHCRQVGRDRENGPAGGRGHPFARRYARQGLGPIIRAP